MINWFIRTYKRIRDNNEGLAEINEVILKMARRQNYDLIHCIDYLQSRADTEYIVEFCKRLRRRCNNYRDAFNPSDYGKDYVSRLHKEIHKLETDREKIYRIM